jgi:hypothetical protein
VKFVGPAKFELGQVVATPQAIRFCGEHHIDIFALLLLHARCHWGELSAGDALANDVAVIDGARILSSYTFPAGKVWVLTEATNDEGTRASTCVMLPTEY